MIGKTVSHYQIIEEIGRGGMGEVYLAEDSKLERQVALKFLPRYLTADKESRLRFEREAKAAAALNHPNIVTVYEIGEHEGQVFIAMEYIEGQTLKELISDNRPPSAVHRLPIPQVIDIALQIASGLFAAHAKGIIHRDIKPQNILVDKDSHAKILDFGLAKLKGVSSLTKESSTLGTVAYMSPEQAMGKEVDERSDLWSLGVILYEMLTGKLPFPGEYDQAMLYAVINEEPEPVTGLRSGIPLELERLIDKALAKDPAERYQDCADLIADLRRMNKDEQPLKSGVEKKRTAGRAWHRIGFKIAIFVLLISTIFAAGYFLFLGKKKPEISGIREATWKNSIAVMPFRDFSPRHDQEYFCDGMTDALIGRLTRILQLKVISLTSVMVYKNRERDLRKIAEELGVNTVLDGNVQRENDRIRVSAQLINAADQANLWSDHYDRQLDSMFEVHDDISQAIATALKLQLLPSSAETSGATIPKNMEAYEYYLKGMHFIKTKYVLSFREEDFRSGVEMFNKALEIEPGYAMPYFGLCWAYEHHYQVTGVESDSRLSQKNTELFWRLAPNSAQSNALMGYMLYEYQGKYEQAFGFLKKALESNANIGEVNFLVGMCYLYAGLYDQGIHFLTRAVELDPYYLWAPYKLACSYMGAGEYKQAAQNFNKYFELTPIEPLIWPGKYLALNIWMNRLQKAEETLAKGEKATPDAEWVKKYRAVMHARQGEKEKALAFYRNSEVYALLGMNNEAFRELNKEIRGTSPIPYLYYQYLLHNPFYDNLRADPRFDELLKREQKLYNEYAAKYGNL